MPEFTFDEIRSLGDAHHQYMYRFVISPLPGSGGADERTLSMRQVSCELPASSVANVNYYLSGYKMNEAGLSQQSGSLSVSFIESRNIDVRKRLESWLELGNNRQTNVHAAKSVYQTTAEVFLTDGEHNDKYTGKFIGFWISTVGASSLSNSGNNASTIQATFTYDLWVPA